jgi:hypothetical protein
VADEAEAPPPTSPVDDPFATPFGDAPCPPEGWALRLRHADAPGLPGALGRGFARRSEDGRRLQLVFGGPEIDAEAARQADPGPGQARFEMEALRTRRRALSPRVLGRPEATRGALTHARIVGADAFYPFGVRYAGRVELTAVEAARVCGRIDLDDGRGRVRGEFVVPVVGAIPE